MDEKTGRRAYTKAVIIVPVVLLFAAIAITQVYVMPAASDPPPNRDLQLLGYGNNGTPLTLSNAGTTQITILKVTYDGRLLTQGIIGGTGPMFAMSQNSSSTLCYAVTNDLIFPVGNHWNMDTGGLCTPSVPPNAVTTLYLGVFSKTNSSHLVVIVTQEGNYTFTV